MSYMKDDLDRWFEINYLPSQRLVYVSSIDAETTSGDGESGTDCQMSELFIKAIVHLNNISTKPIFVHMNNLGGSEEHGMAMYDAIRASRSHIYCISWGMSYSMGSIILQACDSRIITPNCCLMIHDGTQELSGTCKAVENWSLHMGKLRKQMYEIYCTRMKAAKPRITIDKIEKMCSHDKIFTAQEAVEAGLADWILETLQDPYIYHATDTQNAKWKSGMKLGKHETEQYEGDE